jgi:ABC-2 type transport system permease protein
VIAVFLNSLSRQRGQVLGWGLSLGLLGMLIVRFYDTLVAQSDTLMNLLASYPPEMMAFFGAGPGAVTTEMFTPSGYLSFEFFSFMPVILGIFAVLAGSGLLAADEESGALDLILAHPVSRTALILGRLLAFAAATVGILALAWLGLLAGMRGAAMSIPAGELARAFYSVGAVMLFFGALALFLSLLLPSRRLAASIAGLFLVASYFTTSLARLNDSLKAAARFSPLNYYQGGAAIDNFNPTWLGGLLLSAALLAALAWLLFQRRDIRVGGEAGWRWPLPWSGLETRRHGAP